MSSTNIIRKVLLTLVMVVGLVAVAAVTASDAEAHNVNTVSGGSRLEEAYHQKTNTETGQLMMRINNWRSEEFHGLICATEVATNGSFHRGCFRADLAPRWSTTAAWSTGDFGVTTHFGGWVRYTYQAEDGSWRTIPHFAVVTLN